MRKVFVKDFRDVDGLEPIVCDAWVYLLDEKSVQVFEKSGWNDSLEWGMDGAEINRISRLSAEEFVRVHYKSITLGQATLSSLQIKKIIDFLGLTYEETGALLGGMSKGTIANYVNGVRKAEGPSAALLMERLSLELLPGSMKPTVRQAVTDTFRDHFMNLNMTEDEAMAIAEEWGRDTVYKDIQEYAAAYEAFDDILEHPKADYITIDWKKWRLYLEKHGLIIIDCQEGLWCFNTNI